MCSCRLPESRNDGKLDIVVFIADDIKVKGSTCTLDVTLRNHSDEALELVVCKICVPAALDIKRDVLDSLIG